MVGKKATTSVNICVDSKPALDILHNPVYHAKTKQMGADMLTKHAAVGVVRYNKKLIGLE